MKDYDETKRSSYLQYWDINNLYSQAMFQKLPVYNFEQTDHTFDFTEDLIKNNDKESRKGYFFEVDVQYTQKLHEIHNDLTFLSDRMKVEKSKSL